VSQFKFQLAGPLRKFNSARLRDRSRGLAGGYKSALAGASAIPAIPRQDADAPRSRREAPACAARSSRSSVIRNSLSFGRPCAIKRQRGPRAPPGARRGKTQAAEAGQHQHPGGGFGDRRGAAPNARVVVGANAALRYPLILRAEPAVTEYERKRRHKPSRHPTRYRSAGAGGKKRCGNRAIGLSQPLHAVGKLERDDRRGKLHGVVRQRTGQCEFSGHLVACCLRRNRKRKIIARISVDHVGPDDLWESHDETGRQKKRFHGSLRRPVAKFPQFPS
jgi:hypothetical protein